ncbi:MAG: hypothetical protein JXQ65_15285 [Candidatus Marinimicrobia bacterium]|nr:hypothetical protein [Candidatus Neomarinimicrobiota bacterium]
MKKRSVVIALMLINVLTAQNVQIQHLEQALIQNPNSAELHLNLGKLQYQEVMKGEKEYLKSAVHHFAKATKLDAENCNAFCWLGSTMVMKAKFAVFPPAKAYYVHAGLAKMDDAIEMDTHHVENRFIRGQTCLGIPAFFGRSGTALADFLALEKMMTASPAAFDHETKAEILYYLGKSYKATGNEEKSEDCFARLKSEFGDTELAQKL